MATNDEYQGWTNRETWVINLWLTNEEGTYHDARLCVAAAKGDARLAGEQLEALVTDMVDEATIQPAMLRDVVNAAMVRVNWIEIASSIVEDCVNWTEIASSIVVD